MEICNTPHFVLIHGVSGGAWCWYKISSLMEISGYKVTCLDLKSAGIDQTDANTILSFDDYNKPLVDFLSSLRDNEQVVLVGHSAGGLSVSDAIHKFGKKVKLAVYVAATMLKSGFLTDEDTKMGVPDVSEYGGPDQVYDFEFGLGKDQPPTSVIMKKQFQRSLIYQKSPQEDSTLAAMLLRPGPARAFSSAQFAPDGDLDKVPRIYVKATKDNVIKPEQQDTMIKKWPPLDVYELESDHSPFFSTPFSLFDVLVKAVASLDDVIAT